MEQRGHKVARYSIYNRKITGGSISNHEGHSKGKRGRRVEDRDIKWQRVLEK